MGAVRIVRQRCGDGSPLAFRPSMAELIDIGMEVGTDVPYCLYGTTSHIAGKGAGDAAAADAAMLGHLG